MKLCNRLIALYAVVSICCYSVLGTSDDVTDSEDVGEDPEEILAESDAAEVPKKTEIPVGNIDVRIEPVDESEFSCLGKDNGAQKEDNPETCLHFYVCANETAHKVSCPIVQNIQFYFNPLKMTCDRVAEDFCIVNAPKDNYEKGSQSKSEL